MAREPILNKLPPKLAFAFVAVAFYLSVVLLLIALPLKALYGLLLRPVVWIEWDRRGKDTLVVDFDSARSKAWMERIRPVIGDRAVFLNYSLRKNWKWNSLETQLYEVFGPHGMPERFTTDSLPAVILFRRLRRPKVFTFGARSKDPEEKLEQLRSELIGDH